MLHGKAKHIGKRGGFSPWCCQYERRNNDGTTIVIFMRDIYTINCVDEKQ